MKLQTQVVARGYCFLEDRTKVDASELEKPVHLVIDQHIELIDDEGYFQELVLGKGLNLDLSVAEARAIIKAIENGIAEFEKFEQSAYELI